MEDRDLASVQFRKPISTLIGINQKSYIAFVLNLRIQFVSRNALCPIYPDRVTANILAIITEDTKYV